MERPGQRRILLLGLPLLLASLGQAGAQYQMVLPLQYNCYHPAEARSLAFGNCQSENVGPSALFGNPAGLNIGGSWAADISSSYLSGSQSNITLKSQGSSSFPSVLTLAGRRRSVNLAIGYRQAQATELTFPNPWRPYQRDRADLSLRQLGIGASVQLGKNLRLGLAASRSEARFQWQGPDSSYVDGSAQGFGVDAGLKVSISEDWDLQATVATQTTIRGTSDLLTQPGSDDIGLEGAIPPRTIVALRYRPEPDFSFSAEAEMTGWQSVSWAYNSRVDCRAGAEFLLWGGRAAARLGAFSLSSPLGEADRTLNPDLHNMYFLSCGAGLAMASFSFDIAAASSNPLSGSGLNQNILAASVNVHFR